MIDYFKTVINIQKCVYRHIYTDTYSWQRTGISKIYKELKLKTKKTNKTLKHRDFTKGAIK